MEPSTPSFQPKSNFLLASASFIIVIAGLKAASTIIIPLLLAIFIAIICAPPLHWLQRKKIPNFLAIPLVIIVILAIGFVIGGLVGSSINDFSDQLPKYEAKLKKEYSEALKTGKEWIETQFKIQDATLSHEVLLDNFNPSAAMQMVGNLLTGLGGVLTNAFLILLTVIFILLEITSFPKKIKAAFPQGTHSQNFTTVIENVRRYMALKTIISLVTGIFITIWLAIIGVDYPILWGLIAFLLNYVPNFGSILAAIPAVLLAFIQLGPGSAFFAAIGYVLVNVVIGNFIEPKFMGKGLGLSTLVVFVSLIFWGWVLGPVGMLLSVPLTMTAKIVLESKESTRWIAILLSSETGESETT